MNPSGPGSPVTTTTAAAATPSSGRNRTGNGGLLLRQSLRAVDALTIAFALLLSLLAVWFAPRVHAWLTILTVNMLGSLALGALASADARSLPQAQEGAGLGGARRRTIRFLHDWYPVPVIFLVFKEIYVILHALELRDWDPVLIGIDRAIFHVDPTVWLAGFASPFLTELLQIAYVSYYFLMITLGVELYFRRDERKFRFAIFAITYGFFLSYLGYLSFPAVGPRFTLHSFNDLNADLPGLYFSQWLRDFINSGESIPHDVVNPILFAQRDAFPSGHTQMTLIVMFLAQRYRLRSRVVLHVAGTLLIISTVYLRYHYVADLLGGALFMLFTVWTAPALFRRWEKSAGPARDGSAQAGSAGRLEL